MKKYDLKKIMNDAWRIMRANSVGGVYQLDLSQALRTAWSIAKKDRIRADLSAEIVHSGKYDYILNEKNLMSRMDLVRKALQNLRNEGEKNRAAYRNGLTSKSEFDEYCFFKSPAESNVLIVLKNSFKATRVEWNPSWVYKMGPLPEEEF